MGEAAARGPEGRVPRRSPDHFHTVRLTVILQNRLALSALLSNPVRSIIMQKTATLPDTQTFNVKIPFEGSPITNQRASGRCWLFASTNVFRVAIMKKHNLQSFELSQAYLFFWDKLEKANWFLEQIIDTKDEDLDGRLVQELLGSPVSDGGQWDMVANLVKKYGLVPQVLYPDAYSAMSSGAMDSIITAKLREYALTLRSLAGSGSKSKVAAAKDQMMQNVHRILTLMLGPPPKPDTKFSWEYYDAHGKYHHTTKTPLEFASELSTPSSVRTLNADVSEMFSLVNDPRNKYGQLLTVSRLGNVVGGRPITYVNVDMKTMKAATIAMLKVGMPVFFGSDVGQFSDSQSGIMDTALFDYSLAFNIDLGMDKTQRLKARASAMTHAMVRMPRLICGVVSDLPRQRLCRSQTTYQTNGIFLGVDSCTDRRRQTGEVAGAKLMGCLCWRGWLLRHD